MKVGGYFFFYLVSTELQILFATQLKASLTGRRESATRRFLISIICVLFQTSAHILVSKLSHKVEQWYTKQ